MLYHAHTPNIDRSHGTADLTTPTLEEMCRAGLASLTPREHDVVERIARGLEIKEIARELGIGYQTVKMHIARARSKLGLRNRLEIAIVMHGGIPDCLKV